MNKCQFMAQTIKRMRSKGGQTYAEYLAEAWQDICDTVAYNKDKPYTETVSYIPHNFSTSQSNWPTFGILAPGGIIYFLPWSERKIYKLDTNTDTITSIDVSSIATKSRNWCGAVYHYQTGYIYAMPGYAGKILKVDPKTDTCTTFGSFSTSSYQYFGCSIGKNGCIYSAPGSASKVLKIDPTTDSISYIGSSYSGTNKWDGGVASPTGDLYFVPRYQASGILKIDSNTDTVSTLYNYGTNDTKFSNALYTPYNKLYLAGYTNNSAIYDTQNNTSSNIVGTGYGGVSLGPNGVAYFIKRSSSAIDRVDTTTDTALTSLSCSNSYINGILAPNGCIYAACTDSKTNGILKIAINITGGRNFKEPTLLSPFLNKY